MRPTRRAVLAATVSTIALAGCAGDGTETETPDSDGGGGDDGDSETPTQSPSPDPTASPTSSPASESPTSTTMDSATVQVRAHPDLGEILVDSEGTTLYMFDSDTRGEGASTCSGGCADAWPPLTVEDTPTAGEGVAAELSTFEREDDSTQVAASGWPLYYYAGDEQPGDANGQGANDVWWVLRPDGTPVRPESTATPTPASPADVQVRAHPDLGEILVDSEGMTLYMFDSDTQGEGASTCSGGCAEAWPPLTVDGDPSAGADVTADLTTFEREDDSTQVAASGWPLYYYAGDENPDDANGQGANDVWWVLRPDGTPVRSSTSTATVTPTDTSDDGGGGVY